MRLGSWPSIIADGVDLRALFGLSIVGQPWGMGCSMRCGVWQGLKHGEAGREKAYIFIIINIIGRFILGAIWGPGHLETRPVGLEVALYFYSNFSSTLQSGPLSGPCNIKSIGPLVGSKLEIPL